MNRKILVVDLDRTLFNNSQRDHLVPEDPTICSNWDEWALACDGDTPIKEWVELVELLAASKKYDICFLTSRGYVCATQTIDCLKKHVPIAFERSSMLIMRQADEHETPADFKMKYIKEIGSENIAFAIDDDPKVCAMMIEMGIAVLNVNPQPEKQDA